LNNETSNTTARASSGQVRVVYIPRDVIQNFMKEHSEVALNLIKEQQALVNRLSFLWINAQ
jgi:CRP-like cAMP-binding protein